MFEKEFFSRTNTQVGYFERYGGYVGNPGMGIVGMLLSDHMTAEVDSTKYGQAHAMPPHWPTVEEMRRTAQCPMVDDLYIRVGWCDVQTEKGKLHLSERFERALEEVYRSGKTWSFRIMHCSPSNPQNQLIPDFLDGKLPMITLKDQGLYGGCKKLPVFTEDYFKYWDEMMHLLGERFDKDTSLAYADVSGFGFWGEGHHCGIGIKCQDAGEGFGTPDEHEKAVERLIKSHSDAFPNTPMSLNLHLCDYEAGRKALADGAWCRRDSYGTYFKSYEAQYGLMRRPDAAMVFETVVPNITVRKRTPDDDNKFLTWTDLPGYKCDYGSNYGVIGFNPFEINFAYDNYPEVFRSFYERLGYRIRPSIVWLTEGEKGKRDLVLGLVNDGCATAPGDVRFTAWYGSESSETVVNGGDIFGRMKLAEIPLPDRFSGQVKLSAALMTKKGDRPVRFATQCADGVAPYTLTLDI